MTYISLHTETIVVFEKSKETKKETKYVKNLSPKRLKWEVAAQQSEDYILDLSEKLRIFLFIHLSHRRGQGSETKFSDHLFLKVEVWKSR